MAALGAVLALVVVLASQAVPATAAPVGITIDNSAVLTQTYNVGTTHLVNFRYNDEGVPSASVLTSSVPAFAYFVPLSFSVVPGFNADGTQVITGDSPTTPGVITVTDDTGDANVEDTAVQGFIFCATAGTTNISFTQGGGTSLVIAVTCQAVGTNSITFSVNPATISAAITVTAVCTAPGQILTASPTTSGAFGATVTNGTFNSVSQVTCVAAGNMVASYTCAVVSSVVFTINGVSNTLTCGGTTTGGLVLSMTTGTSATVSGTCVLNAVLTQTGPAYFAGATINGVTVTTGVLAGSIPCTAAGPIVASIICNSYGTVSIALGASTVIFTCTAAGTGYGGGYNPYLNAYPTTCATGAYNTGAYPYNGAYNTGVYPYNQYNQYANTGCYNQQQYTNVPTSLTITTASSSVTCGGTSQVTVRVTGTNGQTVADGTAVALAASVGTLSPASASTSAGAVTATYTAPAGIPNTSVTLRATAGSATNTTGVSVTCASTSTAPATTAPVQPPYSPPAPPAGNLVISPPNTGDAGLLVAEMTNCGDVAS